ncbi:MAG TPA: bacteriohopanetetrol glucosamine biosynthesis glycosyltransferase HpnI [Methylomirabilota bacterium]|nr:bacteriohopanetetrol glucosamine biosynthesis glycosyltransferase HpnI [Methylomirabilota bacterium]
MSVVTIALGGLACLSFLIVLWQWVAASRFTLASKLSEAPALDESPSITILKPVKGAEEHTRECFESWLSQDYAGKVQVVFGARSANDPACAVIEALRAAHPDKDVQYVHCPEALGPNAKVSTLVQLSPQARHEFVLISDADVWADRDFLKCAMGQFRSPEVGLVCSLYALTNSKNTAMHLEALHVNVDFWSQVLQGQMLSKMDFALGAVMIIRREMLEKIGGFQALLEYLADDYQLGNKAARAGGVVSLADTVVECRSGFMSARAVWDHQVRWSRTVRVCQPIPYFFSILSNATLFSALLAAVAPCVYSLSALAAVVGTRVVMAMHLQRRLLPAHERRSPSALIVLKDLLQVAVWAAAFLGNTVVWRGEKFRVLPDGKLQKV